MKNDDLVPAPAADLGALSPATMPRLFELAVAKGPEGVEALERLAALHERLLAQSAAREFAAAMAAFQEECPPIRKTSTGEVATKAGGRFSYAYAELDEIARTIRPILHKHGLSYSWDSTLSENAAMLSVVCTVSHANGHKATAAFVAPTEAVTNAMSPQQRHAAALTFARRQSLISVLGLTTCDPDHDGAVREPEAKVTPDQVVVLMDLIDKCPSGTNDRLLAYIREQWGAKTLDELPASQFGAVKGDLEKKIRKAGFGAP